MSKKFARVFWFGEAYYIIDTETSNILDCVIGTKEKPITEAVLDKHISALGYSVKGDKI